MVLENEAAGSHELKFFLVRPHEYAVRYTKPYRLRLETRVDEAGRVVGRTETAGQPELKGRRELEEARAIAAREQAEREAAAQAAIRAQAEHEAHERLRAERIAERDAYYRQHAADLERLEAEARHQRAEAAADARRMSEEWNADRIFPAWRDRLPEDVRRTFDQETVGTTEIRYYQYIVGDQTYYSAHFNLAGGQRTEVRVDPSGRLLGKRDVTAAEEDRFLNREQWFHTQWGQPGAERVAEHPVEHVERVPAVANGQPVKINPEDAPAAVREAVRREARDERNLEYYRVDVPGRNNDQYIVGYTDDALPLDPRPVKQRRPGLGTPGVDRRPRATVAVGQVPIR